MKPISLTQSSNIVYGLTFRKAEAVTEAGIGYGRFTGRTFN